MTGGPTTGDRFVLQRWEEDNRWHWELYQSHSPYGAIARSTQGYASPSAALRSIQSACYAFRGAARDENGLRIERREIAGQAGFTILHYCTPTKVRAQRLVPS